MFELNIISQSTLSSDIEPIFGPCLPSDNWEPLQRFKDMADIWVLLGLFPSRSQAIKNNHGGDIPDGFTDIVKKKKRHKGYNLEL